MATVEDRTLLALQKQLTATIHGIMLLRIISRR